MMTQWGVGISTWGAKGFGPVTKTGDLVATFEQAIAAVEAGEVAVVDVRVEPGYSAVATAAMLRGTEKPSPAAAEKGRTPN